MKNLQLKVQIRYIHSWFSIQSSIGLSLFSPNKKAMTSDVYFDPSNICFQMITFKKKTVLRTYVKIVLNKYFLYQKHWEMEGSCVSVGSLSRLIWEPRIRLLRKRIENPFIHSKVTIFRLNRPRYWFFLLVVKLFKVLFHLGQAQSSIVRYHKKSPKQCKKLNGCVKIKCSKKLQVFNKICVQ